MLHARKDYNRIQDPEGKFGKDEPVFLVRAQDVLSVKAMEAWAEAAHFEGLLKNDARLQEMAAMVYEHIAKTIRWQNENGCRMPDL